MLTVNAILPVNELLMFLYKRPCVGGPSYFSIFPTLSRSSPDILPIRQRDGWEFLRDLYSKPQQERPNDVDLA